MHVVPRFWRCGRLIKTLSSGAGQSGTTRWREPANRITGTAILGLGLARPHPSRFILLPPRLVDARVTYTYILYICITRRPGTMGDSAIHAAAGAVGGCISMVRIQWDRDLNETIDHPRLFSLCSPFCLSALHSASLLSYRLSAFPSAAYVDRIWTWCHASS